MEFTMIHFCFLPKCIDDRNITPTNNQSHWLVLSPASVLTFLKLLDTFARHGVRVRDIELRSSGSHPGSDYVAECEQGHGNIWTAAMVLRTWCSTVYVHDSKPTSPVPWFPRRIKDLDLAHCIQYCSTNLHIYHVGCQDIAYTSRRKYFAEFAYRYRHGQPLPHIEYTDEEIAIWGSVFEKLRTLFPQYACREHNQCFQLMIENCGYRRDHIPQLEDVNRFLRDATGFSLRPVAGILSPRNFLAGLAFRVFFCAQYLRHTADLCYDEPDYCHDLLGHAPLLADPSFAKLAHEIGLASIGAPDDYIKMLSSCFWFTIELGVCKEQINGETLLRAYGGGLLSSVLALQHCLSGPVKEFQPGSIEMQNIFFSPFQPAYFVSNSIKDATEKIMKFAETIPRDFIMNYDPYTKTIKTTEINRNMQMLLRAVEADMARLL